MEIQTLSEGIAVVRDQIRSLKGMKGELATIQKERNALRLSTVRLLQHQDTRGNPLDREEFNAFMRGLEEMVGTFQQIRADRARLQERAKELLADLTRAPKGSSFPQDLLEPVRELQRWTARTGDAVTELAARLSSLNEQARSLASAATPGEPAEERLDATP